MKKRYHVFWQDKDGVYRSRENLSSLADAHRIAQKASRRFGSAHLNQVDGPYSHRVIEQWRDGRRANPSRRNPSKAVSLQNFTGTVTKNSDGTVSIRGRKK